MSWRVADTARSIPELFEAQALRNPARMAIGGTAWRPTFAELDGAANRLAHALLERGATAHTRVALLMRHDAPLIASVLAALKTGATVVVLNATDPPARLEQLRADTTPALIVTDSGHRSLALRAGFARDAIVGVAERPDGAPHPAPGIGVAPDDLALLLCTSGSTGRPVAVAQTHRNVLHNVLRHTNGLGVCGDDRIVLLASPSGGQGAGTVWTALLNGATLCPFPVIERGLTGLARWLDDNGVTVFVASASLFRHFVATLDGACLPGIRLVRLGSEQALRSDFEAWREHFSPRCSFANTYSSSETGAIAQHLMGADAEPAAGRLPAGRAAQDTEILVLGEDGAELAPGRTGGIVVRSRYISPGYLGEEALMARRFGTGEDGVRWFRTGDYGCRGEDGLLTVLGRSDNLVKIRGNRVSLSEVETTLSMGAGVAGAAVCASVSPRGDTRLTAYVVPAPVLAATPTGLRRELRTKLPDHAVPSAFVFLEQLPLTAHGKVDRERLAQLEATAPAPPAASAPEGATAELPASETEEIVAALWSRVLERDHVGREEDFFDLGGDSLAAAEIAVGVQQALGVEIGLRAFATEPTVAALAHTAERMRMAGATDESERPLERAAKAGPPPASFAQERIWRLCETPQAADGYTVAAALQIRGPLDVRMLRLGIDHLIRRHDQLRTTFAEREGRLVQVVHPAAPVEMPLLDVSAAADPATQAGALLREAASTAFDLERGPLVCFQLVRLSPEEHELHRINHHIISDGWSWRVFLQELAALYEARHGGRPPALAEKPPLQYGDFAAWQRRRMEPGSPRRRALLAWWREIANGGEVTAPPFAHGSPVDGVPPSEGTISWGLPPQISSGLGRLGREAGATYYMVRLAGFAALLAAESGEPELLLGTYMTTRGQPGTRSMFGCFTHLAPLRLCCAGELTVAEWLARVRVAVLDANEHAELPYERAAEELHREGVTLPGIQTLFAPTERQPAMRFAGLEVASPEHSIEHYMPSGFSFLVDRDREIDGCRVDFDARIYDPVRVGAFVERYQRLAAELCGGAGRSLRELLDRSARTV